MALHSLIRAVGAAGCSSGQLLGASTGGLIAGRAVATALLPAATSAFSTFTGGNPAEEMKPPSHGAAVLLINGGTKSAALLSYWMHHDHGQKLWPLFVRYGQRNSFEEESAARAVCRHFGLDLVKIDAGLLGDQLPVLQAPRTRDGGLPLHDPLLVTLGAAYGAEVGASHQVMCVSREDLTSGAAGMRHADNLLQLLEPPQRLLAPLAGLTRAGVIRMGQQVGAPWHLTYSCTEGSKGSSAGLAPGVPARQCGKCQHCRARQAAFAAAGVKDTSVYAS